MLGAVIDGFNLTFRRSRFAKGLITEYSLAIIYSGNFK